MIIYIVIGTTRDHQDYLVGAWSDREVALREARKVRDANRMDCHVTGWEVDKEKKELIVVNMDEEEESFYYPSWEERES